MKYFKLLFITLFISSVLIFYGCSQNNADSPKKQVARTDSTAVSTTTQEKPKVTFVELGSVNCIPCKMMQPVMEAIEEEFGSQIEVVFHDVWKDAEPGRKYGIKLIPTQVFLDETGTEFFRHEGFFPKEDIEKLLVEKGLKIFKQVEIEK